MARNAGEHCPRKTITLVACVLLVSLSVAYSGVACVDECTCSSPTATLFEVDCSDLSLISIPSDIPTNTTTLRLANNFLANLAGQPFSTLTDLETLELSNNPIRFFRTGILTGLNNLRFLYISEANLESIDDSAFHGVAATLEVLVLSSNTNLRNISSELFGGVSMVALNQLILRDTGLEKILPSSFVGLPNLLKLDLSFNDLMSGHLLQSFVGLESLEELLLSSNKIEFLNERMFEGLTSLAKMYLDQNELNGDMFSNSAFSNTPNLTTLWLDTEDIGTNGLSTLPEAIFDTLSTLSTLKLAGTNWNCCGLSWLNSLSALADGAAVTCARPQRARGQLLTQAINDGNLDVNSCGQDVPNSPELTLINDFGDTWVTISWSPVHGNAYDVDYYNIEYAQQDTCTTPDNLSMCRWVVGRCSTGTQPAQSALYSLNMADCNISGPIGNGPYDTYNFNLTELSPYTEYYMRARAHNVLGWDLWNGTVSNFTTLDATPSSPQNILIDSFDDSLQIHWDAPTVPRGLVIQYTILVYNSSGFSTSMTVDGGASEVFVRGLSAFTSYTVTVTAETRAGLGNSSLPTTARTAEKVPAAPNDTPRVTYIGSTSATLEWNSLPAGAQNGVILSTSLLTGSPAQVMYTGSDTSVTLQGLIPATRYTFFVLFSNSAGQGASGPDIGIRTLNAAPGQPNEPVGDSTSNDSIIITWDEPSITNGAIVQYDVEMREQGSILTTLSSYDGTVIVGASNFTALKRNLRAAHTYEFRVRANTEVNSSLVSGNFSSWGSATVLDGISEPVPVSSSPLTSTSLTVSFQYPTTSNGAIQAFSVYQINKSQHIPIFKPIATVDEAIVLVATVIPEWNVSAGDTYSVLHSALDPYTNYSYTVVANTSAGESAFGTLGATARTDVGIPALQPAPSLLVYGHSQIEVSWDPPEFPNGVIVAFEVFRDGILVYTGVPPLNEWGRFAVNVTNLEDGTAFQFSVVAQTSVGKSVTSGSATAETTSSNPDVKATVVITLLCVLIVVLSLGMVRERTFDAMLIRRSTGLHGSFFRRDKDGNITDGIDNADDASSDSGSEYGHDEVKRPSLERVAHLRKSKSFDGNATTSTMNASVTSGDDSDDNGEVVSKIPPTLTPIIRKNESTDDRESSHTSPPKLNSMTHRDSQRRSHSSDPFDLPRQNSDFINVL